MTEETAVREKQTRGAAASDIAKRSLAAARDVIRRITGRKRAEEALEASRVLLDRTFASLNEAVFVVEPNTHTIIACNPAAECVFGYSDKEMMGRNTEFLHVDRGMYEDFGRKLFLALDTDGVFHTEHLVRRKDGGILSTEHTVTEIVDDSGQRTGLVSVVRDVTERKRAEEELTKHREHLAELVEKRTAELRLEVTERKRAEEALRRAREELEGKVEHQMLRRNPYGLTFRELTVLHLVGAGRSGKEIGITLGISPLTAQKHISNILGKMGAASRTEAGVRAVRERLLD